MDQNNKVITFINPASPYAEAYKKLQLNIQYLSVDKKNQVIQVTSSQASEGKTYTAINLAAVYALKNKKAIVIDLDFRKPKVHKMVERHNENGLVDVLADNIKIEDAIYHHESGVDILVRGSKTPNIELMLESGKLANLINDLRKEYDVIILDCPPVLAVTDSSLIARLADGLIFVVTYNQTKKDDIKEAVKRLKMAGSNILGFVFSKVEKNVDKKYYKNEYAYYGQEDKGGNE